MDQPVQVGNCSAIFSCSYFSFSLSPCYLKWCWYPKEKSLLWSLLDSKVLNYYICLSYLPEARWHSVQLWNKVSSLQCRIHKCCTSDFTFCDKKSLSFLNMSFAFFDPVSTNWLRDILKNLLGLNLNMLQALWMEVCSNSFHPNISIHIFHTVLCTFTEVLTRRICLTIRSFFNWWSFPLFSHHLNVWFSVDIVRRNSLRG